MAARYPHRASTRALTAAASCSRWITASMRPGACAAAPTVYGCSSVSAVTRVCWASMSWSLHLGGGRGRARRRLLQAVEQGDDAVDDRFGSRRAPGHEGIYRDDVRQAADDVVAALE